jgi:hypothetical protein
MKLNSTNTGITLSSMDRDSTANGKQIEVIFLPDGERVRAQELFSITFESTFHGEYDIPWGVVRRDDVEIARWNLKHCVGFEWAKSRNGKEEQ